MEGRSPGSVRRPPDAERDNSPVDMTRRRFEELVADALDMIPPGLAAAMDNVVVLVDDRHDTEPDLLGLYEGVALTERTSNYGGVLPDRIMIYQDAILDFCDDEDDVVHEVAVTVVHEVAHHFGIDEDTLQGLGWG
jgi:predicted Zn-dependent protease with MMP-like domain